MERLILCVCLVAALSFFSIIAMAGLIIWKFCFSPHAKEQERVQQELTELQKQQVKKEQELAEGWENMMHYSGLPRKEGF